MRFLFLRHIWIGIGALLLLIGCEPEFELFAPDKEVFVVTGILNPAKKEQFIRINSVFQTEGDAYAFAQGSNLTAKGLQVILEGNDLRLEAEEVDTLPKDPGDFSSQQTIYRFQTRGDRKLMPGGEYTLTIRKPGDESFEPITASTKIPTTPVLVTPGKEIYNINNYMYTYPTLDLTEDFNVFFQKGDGHAFEVRLFLDYEDGGEMKTGRWGPTALFFEPVGCGLSVGSRDLCFQIPAGSIPRFLRNLKEQVGAGFSYYDEPQVSGRLDELSTTCWVEVTSVDEQLARFLYSSQSFGFGLNLLMDKPELTNISGPHIGVFGSIATDMNYVNLSVCTKYEAGWITTQPSFCN